MCCDPNYPNPMAKLLLHYKVCLQNCSLTHIRDPAEAFLHFIICSSKYMKARSKLYKIDKSMDFLTKPVFLWSYLLWCVTVFGREGDCFVWRFGLRLSEVALIKKAGLIQRRFVKAFCLNHIILLLQSFSLLPLPLSL